MTITPWSGACFLPLLVGLTIGTDALMWLLPCGTHSLWLCIRQRGDGCAHGNWPRVFGTCDRYRRDGLWECRKVWQTHLEPLELETHYQLQCTQPRVNRVCCWKSGRVTFETKEVVSTQMSNVTLCTHAPVLARFCPYKGWSCLWEAHLD